MVRRWLWRGCVAVFVAGLSVCGLRGAWGGLVVLHFRLFFARGRYVRGCQGHVACRCFGSGRGLRVRRWRDCRRRRLSRVRGRVVC